MSDKGEPDDYTVSLSLSAELLPSDKCASETNSNASSMICQSPSFLLVAILLHALRHNLAHNPKPSDCERASRICSAWPVAYYCSNREWIELLS